MKQLKFILPLLILNACQPPEDVKVSCTNNTMFLPQMAKDYFLFKEGTYWIYENKATKEIDSLYVSEFENYTGNNSIYTNLNLTKCYESYFYSINSNGLKICEKGLYPNYPVNGKKFIEQFFYIKETNHLTNQIYQIVNFLGDSIYNSGNCPNRISIIDSLSIKTKIYKGILQVENLTVGIDDKHFFSIARNVGIIQYITFDNQEYDLIRYHIEQ